MTNQSQKVIELKQLFCRHNWVLKRRPAILADGYCAKCTKCGKKGHILFEVTKEEMLEILSLDLGVSNIAKKPEENQ